MRLKICCGLLAFVLIAFTSCDGFKKDTEYYVKYVAEAASEAVSAEEHPIILSIPAVYKVKGNCIKCYCKQSFEKEYGPFYSGESVSIMPSDSPGEHSYTVYIYVKKGRDGMYNLVSQGRMGTSYVIP